MTFAGEPPVNWSNWDTDDDGNDNMIMKPNTPGLWMTQREGENFYA